MRFVITSLVYSLQFVHQDLHSFVTGQSLDRPLCCDGESLSVVVVGVGGGAMTGLSWVTTASQLSGRSQVESGLTGVAVAGGNTPTL